MTKFKSFVTEVTIIVLTEAHYSRKHKSDLFIGQIRIISNTISVQIISAGKVLVLKFLVNKISSERNSVLKDSSEIPGIVTTA